MALLGGRKARNVCLLPGQQRAEGENGMGSGDHLQCLVKEYRDSSDLKNRDDIEGIV
jgi:hypothetical protein